MLSYPVYLKTNLPHNHRDKFLQETFSIFSPCKDFLQDGGKNILQKQRKLKLGKQKGSIVTHTRYEEHTFAKELEGASLCPQLWQGLKEGSFQLIMFSLSLLSQIWQSRIFHTQILLNNKRFPVASCACFEYLFI